MDHKSFPRFLIIWCGQFISSIGSGLTAFSLGVYAFNKTSSATVYSLIILFAFLPSYLLKPIGGTLSDRLDRRLLMIVGDLGSALGLLFILIMLSSGFQDMWVIYIGVATSSTFVALQNPAYKASITDMVDEAAYSKASGLMQLAESARFLISPIIAGFLYAIMKIEYILMIDIATFTIAVFAVFAIKGKIKADQPVTHKEHFLTDFKDGFKYTFAHKGLLWLLSITSIITFAVGFLQSLIGPMILAFTNAKTLGVIQTIAASGMLASSFFIGLFSKNQKQVAVLSASLGLAGIFYALFGVSTNLVFITAAGFLFFSTLPFVNTSLEVLIRKNVDNRVQGRVWSIVSLISQLGMIIAFCCAGILADKLFNPLLQPDGVLASSVGKLIGAGPGRGIGFMFVLSGLLVTAVAGIIHKNQHIRALEKH
ncbi:MAG TPA: MFS transporter [bacterium]|nr:MFS transporter [bacterium]HPN45042.1 MFS transporter [bacterium]